MHSTPPTTTTRWARHRTRRRRARRCQARAIVVVSTTMAFAMRSRRDEAMSREKAKRGGGDQSINPRSATTKPIDHGTDTSINPSIHTWMRSTRLESEPNRRDSMGSPAEPSDRCVRPRRWSVLDDQMIDGRRSALDDRIYRHYAVTTVIIQSQEIGVTRNQDPSTSPELRN